MKKMKELLVNCSRTHSFTHQLKALLMHVDKFLAEVQVSWAAGCMWGTGYYVGCRLYLSKRFALISK